MFKRSEPTKESILHDIDFELELMHTDKINVSYIINLIASLNTEDENERTKDIKFIMQGLEHASDPKLCLKVELIKGFLEKVAPTLSREDSMIDAYNKYEEQMIEEELAAFAKEVNIQDQILREQLASYEYSNMSIRI